MERNIFIVKSGELRFHWIIVYRSTHQHTLEKNLFNLKTVELNLPRIHISEHTCHCTLERSFCFLSMWSFIFTDFKSEKDANQHTQERNTYKRLCFFSHGLCDSRVVRQEFSQSWYCHHVASCFYWFEYPLHQSFGYHWMGNWPVPQYKDLGIIERETDQSHNIKNSLKATIINW